MHNLNRHTLYLYALRYKQTVDLSKFFFRGPMQCLYRDCTVCTSRKAEGSEQPRETKENEFIQDVPDWLILRGVRTE